jgi:glutamine amidotransferase
MNVTIVDYNSGNISSVINSFKEVAKEKIKIEVSSNLNKIKSSDKIVLPGQGSFKSCVDSLNSIDGLVDTLNEITIINKKPCLGFVWAFKCLLMLGMRKQKHKV